MKRKEVVFICGPYRAETVYGIVQNIRHAEEYAIKFWKLGYSVICPHKNTSLFDGICEDNVWLEGVKELLRRSDIVACIPGWRDSKGSVEEFELAKELGKMIIDLDVDEELAIE